MGLKQKTAKLLSRLFDAGYDSDRKIAAMTVLDMVHISGISVTDMEVLGRLQEAISQRRVLEFLAEDGAGIGREAPAGAESEGDRCTNYGGGF